MGGTQGQRHYERVASAPPGDSGARGCSEVHPQARSHEAGQGHRLELRGVSAEELEAFLKANKKQLRTFPMTDIKLDSPFRKLTVATG